MEGGAVGVEEVAGGGSSVVTTVWGEADAAALSEEEDDDTVDDVDTGPAAALDASAVVSVSADVGEAGDTPALASATNTSPFSAAAGAAAAAAAAGAAGVVPALVVPSLPADDSVGFALGSVGGSTKGEMTGIGRSRSSQPSSCSKGVYVITRRT